MRLSKTTEYNSWLAMKQRCYYTNHKYYEYYGARGIRVHDAWVDNFAQFLADMGHKPSKNHTLDRIDCDGDYTPTNCRWATRKEQTNNRRVPSMSVEHNGAVVSLRELADITGINYTTLYKRYNAGDRGERLVRSNRLSADYYGEQLTLHEIADRTGIKYDTLHGRFNAGDRGERLVRKPNK